MKKSDIVVGEVYTAKVSGRLVNVRILRTVEVFRGVQRSAGTAWKALNLSTNRELHIRSAARLRLAQPAKPKTKLIDKVSSLADLRTKAQDDPRYAKLAMAPAANLGGGPRDLAHAFDILRINAQETDEMGVVNEVNFCRDLI